MVQVTPLPDGCPWADWARPNVKYCEFHDGCGWITARANTWSNVSFVIAAYYMYVAARARRGRGDYRGCRALQLMAVGALLTGIVSFLFHASYTQFFQWFDYVGMYTFAAGPLVLNARRLMPRHVTTSTQWRCVVFVVLFNSALTLLFYRWHWPVQLIVLELIVLLLISETWLYARDCRDAAAFSAAASSSRGGRSSTPPQPRRPSYSAFRRSLAALVAAFTCTVLDVTGVWCARITSDTSWLQGHACWHLFMAVCVYYQFQHYRQFAWDGQCHTDARGDGGYVDQLLPLTMTRPHGVTRYARG